MPTHSLHLQRASAGSGKTYALAKKFIWYFITIADEGRERRLRTPAELSDSLDHILAVTFTNKATNEMQQRIVEKLYALAYPPQGERKPDYLEDFMKELKSAGHPVTEKEISETARCAVGILLNNYSDFNVSTIDSFFQQVLRTFAYESDLSDSYRLELDTEYLSRMAIDALLEDINSGRDLTGADFWVSEMMGNAKKEGKKWNIFAKSSDDYSLYSFLINSVKRLENEEFKLIRRSLDAYFNSGVDFKKVYVDLRNRYENEAVKAHAELVVSARKLDLKLKKNEKGLDPKDFTAFSRRVRNVLASEATSLLKDSKNKDISDFSQKLPAVYQKRKQKGDTSAYDEIEMLDYALGENYNKWSAIVGSRDFRHWKLYRENLIFMGLLQAIREKRDQYLRENNAIELGETNAMLHDIIGEDDAPFIYERIGTRLNHFLIDEFQDTSKMQWRNLTPLLHESIGRGNENLIIGDAKQSIYRFRNADSSLISRKVEEEFGSMVRTFGTAVSDNTNWRSDLRIVQFNNGFFDFLTTELNRKVGAEVSPERRDFREDYRNVVQHPHNKEERGYVEVHTRSADTDWENYMLTSLTDIIENALSRGFRLRDIAVLVSENAQGERVIERLMEYNSTLPDGAARMEYVSEQSLKLSSSAAVSLVVSVLETISRGAKPEVRSGEDRARRGVADWSQVACNFKYFALRHPELSTPDCLDSFFAGAGDAGDIGEMLRKMQSVTLPALTESIIAEFISDEMRKTDAVFLSAFQDLVLEYCEGHPSDLASFLTWWEEARNSAAISSPEDMDAINVMTIHKSKGLEFPIVILPFAKFLFSDQAKKMEWRWLAPQLPTGDETPLPPFIPVPTDKRVEGTAHENILFQYFDLRKMDAINSFYVAFTRAVNELYIFSHTGVESQIPLSLQGFLESFFGRSDNNEGRIELTDRKVISETDGIYRYGEPYSHFIPENKSKSGIEEEADMKDYFVRPTPDFLMYRMESAPEVVDAEDPELNDDPDPRSEGNILHEVMQSIRVQEDIPRAVRRMTIKGVISGEQASQMAAFLTVKTSGEDVKNWFSEGWRVINERPLLTPDRKMRGNDRKSLRPDRVMVSERGDAVVVDYKFGESLAKSKKYSRQVYEYVETLKNTGRFRSVKGYVWYVKLDRLELVSQ